MLQPDTELHFCVPSNLPSKSGRSFDVLGTLCFFCGICCKVFADYKPFYRNVLVTGVFWLPIALSTAALLSLELVLRSNAVSNV